MRAVWISVLALNIINSVQSNLVNQPNSVISAVAGDNVTLRCFQANIESTDPILWYKQAVGHEPRVMAMVQKFVTRPIFEDGFKSQRFTVEILKGSYHLKISTVEASDEAMYYCGLKLVKITFGTGTFLSVRNDRGVKVSVVQRGMWDSVPAGASVTLQCSVLSESRTTELQVMWFRAASSPSHPSQIIYSHPNSSQQCESGSSTHSCVYNFSKNIVSLNDTGTYYCTVALCGKIVFGNGTRVRLRKFPEHVTSLRPEVICLAGVVVVCMVVIFAEALIIYKMRNSDKSRVRPQQDSVAENTPNQDRDAEDVNYTALHFNKKNPKRVTRKRDQPAICVYSEVSYPTQIINK